MNAPPTLDTVYRAVDRLTELLCKAGYADLGQLLTHRLHVVAWTTSQELLEELQRILNSEAVAKCSGLSSAVEQQVRYILDEIASLST